MMHQVKFLIELHTNDGPRLSSLLELRVKDSATNPHYLIKRYVGIEHPECCKIISHTQIEEQASLLIASGINSRTRIRLEPHMSTNVKLGLFFLGNVLAFALGAALSHLI